MTSQRSSFSPQVILERLTGEQVHEGPVPVSLANLDRPARSNLHALVIGINEYLHHSHLKGAVNDANLFKSYLLNDLFVPETQITTLFDTQATRSQIIKAFQNLATDQNIKHGDPIVIYYAGHGAEVQPPPSHHVADGSRVQSLVPQDAGTTNLSSAAIPPIPDFTISSLLNRIANAKGTIS
ncbi:caspase domain-containing protein [Rhizoctonia solani]|nr:caspase domain-containing protein [Rhizoctonia solani]